MARRFVLVFVTALMIFASAQTSQAILSAVDPGPYTAATGFFPLWYQDTNGLALEQCLTENPAAPGANPFCVLLADATFNDTLPVVWPTNFPFEYFYWIADADTRGGLAPNVKVARMALEGTFTNLAPPPVQGNQTTFTRIRINFVPQATGTHTATTPYGTFTFNIINNQVGKLFRFTEDIPLATPLNFTGALSGKIGPFLTYDPAANPVTFPPPPLGYIGNPLIPHPVVGSPVGVNSFTLAGPNIGGVGINFVTTNLFAVAGKIAVLTVLPTPLTVTRTSYECSVAGCAVDAFANAPTTAVVTFSDASATPVIVNAPMAGDGTGRFWGDVVPATVPAAATVTADNSATNPNNAPNTSLPSNVIDVVSVSAVYSNATGTLTISASSSDQVNPVTLVAVGMGPAGTDLPVPGSVLTPAPPPSVTVTSTKGGSNVAQVVVVP